MLGKLHHDLRIRFPWIFAPWRKFREWQEGNAAAAEVGDVDPTGNLAARHQKLIADIQTGSGYCFGGLAALSGLALGAVFTGSPSPIQLKIAEFTFMTASEAAAYVGYAYFLFWFLNFFGAANIFTPKQSKLSAKAKRSAFVRSAVLAGVVCFAAYQILIDPLLLIRDMRRRVPEFVRLLHCEMEVAEARKSPNYVPTMACEHDVRAMNHPVRMLPRERTEIPSSFGE